MTERKNVEMPDAQTKVDSLIKYKGPSLEIASYEDVIRAGSMPPGASTPEGSAAERLHPNGLKGILRQDGKKQEERRRQGQCPLFPEDRFHQICTAFKLVSHEINLFRDGSGAEFEEYLKNKYPLTGPKSSHVSANSTTAHDDPGLTDTLPPYSDCDNDHPQLIQSLIAELLAESDEAMNWLALSLGQNEVPPAERRDRVAEALVRSKADQLLNLWSRAQRGKSRLSPRAAELVEALIHLVIPTTCESDDPRRIRQSVLNTQSDMPPLELVACHQTFAEIAMAAADRRRTLFRRQRNSKEYPGGEGLLARVFGPGPERGRDPDGRQAARDFLVELAGPEECAFDTFEGRFPRYLHGVVGEAPAGAVEDQPDSGEPDPKLVEWINMRLL